MTRKHRQRSQHIMRMRFTAEEWERISTAQQATALYMTIDIEKHLCELARGAIMREVDLIEAELNEDGKLPDCYEAISTQLQFQED